MKTILSILSILGLCGACSGDCRRVVAVQHYQQHYAVQQAVYPVVIPIAAYPAYHVSYGQDQAAADKIRTLELKLDQALQRLDQVLKSPPAPNMPPAKDGGSNGQVSLSMLEVFRTDCAKCHEASVAAKKGGDFVILEGNELAGLTDKQLRKIVTQVVTEKMPLGGKLTDAKLSAIVHGVDSIK